MFAPPKILESSVFAVLPDELRRNGQASAWTFGKRQGNQLSAFFEGPCVDRNGNLLLTDVAFGRVFRVDVEGRFTLLGEYDGEPNGMAIHADGTLYIADHRNGLVTMDPESGEVTPLLERVRREGFKGLNDLIFDSHGNLYFTDQGQTGMQDPSGRVYRLDKSGAVTLLIDTIPSPNGLALSPDEKTLYVAVTRANQVWRLPLHSDGTTTKVNIFLHLSGGHTGPDGLAVDRTGNLIVCHCGLGVVWVFSPLGEPLYRVNSAAGLDVSNAAFGGADGRTLYITEAETSSLLQVELPHQGLATFAQSRRLEGVK